MNTELFRKSSIDRVNSPEQLNDYIRVTNPGVWVILLAVCALLVGVVIWGVFGVIETKVPATIIVENSKALCYLSASDYSSVKEGMKVDVDGSTGVIEKVEKNPVEIDGNYSSYFLFLSSLKTGDFAYVALLSLDGVEDGVYSASVIVDSINPIYFVIH